MNVKSHLLKNRLLENIDLSSVTLPDCELTSRSVKVIMINEVSPANLSDWFYSKAPDPGYLKTTLSLFHDAGVNVESMQDILDLGIYITTAVKIPKTSYAVETELIKNHLPILQAEIQLFPNLKVIMLMGDVAKKAVNMLYKKEHKTNLIPSQATYKIRKQEFYWDDIRVFPSYIMTGGNILIEKSKRVMIADDIRRMMKIIKN